MSIWGGWRTEKYFHKLSQRKFVFNIVVQLQPPTYKMHRIQKHTKTAAKK